jgi:hypothetical protein
MFHVGVVQRSASKAIRHSKKHRGATKDRPGRCTRFTFLRLRIDACVVVRGTRAGYLTAANTNVIVLLPVVTSCLPER